MSLPIKSVLRALKRDLERVALMAVEEIRFVYSRAAGPTRGVNYASPSSDSSFVQLNACFANAQIVLMTLNISFWLQVFN